MGRCLDEATHRQYMASSHERYDIFIGISFFLISRLIEPILFLLSVQLSETIKVVVQANQRTLLI